MRDIRDDLRERIDMLAREKHNKEIEIASIDQKIAMLDGLLQQEEERVNPVTQVTLEFAQPRQQTNGSGYSSHLALAVLHVFKTHNPATLEQLKTQAIKDGVEFGGKHPGRMIHFLLLGMEQNGIVRRTEDKRWRLLKNIWQGGASFAELADGVSVTRQ
jgi:hypothetical protein